MVVKKFLDLQQFNHFMRDCQLLMLLVVGIVWGGCSKHTAAHRGRPSLDAMIGKMVMVGFRGTELPNDAPVLESIRKGHVGGVILFSRDVPSDFQQVRNVASKAQVTALCAQLRAVGGPDLWIAVDEEGGRVTRLSSKAGYMDADSAFNIGKVNNPETTRQWASIIAEKVRDSGFNLNFAPCADLNIETKTGVIGRLKRSFSNDPTAVVNNAAIFIEEHRKRKVLTCLKHFPGHGSAKGDTHDGFTDVSATWTPAELEPFRRLIEQKSADMVMTAHIFNKNLDPDNPGTLSKAIISGVLRDQLGWKGVVVSDDMHMGAIQKKYTNEKAIELAILAGVDLLCFSNNMSPEKGPDGKIPKDESGRVLNDPYRPNVGEEVHATIKKLVEDGRISKKRIRQSYKRLKNIKR